MENLDRPGPPSRGLDDVDLPWGDLDSLDLPLEDLSRPGPPSFDLDRPGPPSCVVVRWMQYQRPRPPLRCAQRGREDMDRWIQDQRPMFSGPAQARACFPLEVLGRWI